MVHRISNAHEMRDMRQPQDVFSPQHPHDRSIAYDSDIAWSPLQRMGQRLLGVDSTTIPDGELPDWKALQDTLQLERPLLQQGSTSQKKASQRQSRLS
jgi:hypothetical protein